MPLSECISALRTGQSLRNNPMSDPPSSLPSTDLVEIHWDGGQILMQDQQARHRKTSASASISTPSFGLQGKDQPRDVDATKLARFGPPLRCSLTNDDLPVDGISAQQEPEDDLATWLNCTIDDYGLEFLSESTGSGDNTNSIAADKSGDHSVLPKAFAAGSDHGRTQIGQQWVGLVPGAKSSNTPPTTVQNPPTWEFPDSELQKEVPISPPKLPPASSSSGSGGLVNFSHFARPVCRLNPNLQNADRLKSNEKASTTAPSSCSMEPPSGAPMSIISQEQLPPVAATGKGEPKETATTHKGFASVDFEDGSSNDNRKSRNPSAKSTTNLPGSSHDLEKSSDLIPMVASSSLCTGNTISSDPKHKFKRKTQEGGSAAAESGYQSDDAEDDDSAVAKKTAIGRGGGGGSNAKRTRAAEVHNLSERRRRDRINEKMRALQELIPNCNKTDKASMLDEAIEYLKTLQFQVQIMSMSGGGGGLCMRPPPPMMVPPGMQNLVPHQQMAHFSPMGLGMGMGMGFASPMFPTNSGGFPMFGTQCHPSMPMFAPVPTPLAGMNSTPQVSPGLNDRKIRSGSEKGGRKLEEDDGSDEDEELHMHNGSSDPGGSGTTN